MKVMKRTVLMELAARLVTRIKEVSKSQMNLCQNARRQMEVNHQSLLCSFHVVTSSTSAAFLIGFEGVVRALIVANVWERSGQ